MGTKEVPRRRHELSEVFQATLEGHGWLKAHLQRRESRESLESRSYLKSAAVNGELHVRLLWMYKASDFRPFSGRKTIETVGMVKRVT